jgi:1-acyl-sn-glycerol-3-phosphate acyltransferase
VTDRRHRVEYVQGVVKHTASGLFTYAEFFACLTAFLPILAVSSVRHRSDPTQRVPGRWLRRLGRTTGRLTPLWTFEIEGEPPTDIDRTGYVVVANHESMADPFLLSWLPFDMRWVAKEELFRPPLVGWALRWGGDIPLRRGKGESVRAMLDECARALEGGISVMLFPEGTRSKDGDLLPFKDGAFSLAVRMQVPVLPIALSGTREMRPPHSRWFAKANARARILTPIPTRGLGEKDVPAVRERARDAIIAALPALRSQSVLAKAS